MKRSPKAEEEATAKECGWPPELEKEIDFPLSLQKRKNPTVP
jgi:hypothetical protein